MENILIVPICEINSNLLDYIAQSLRRKFKCKVVLSETIPVPQKAYNAKREQYQTIKYVNSPSIS